MFSDRRGILAVKYLLKHGHATQAEIAKSTGMAVSYVNTIAQRLRDSFIVSKPHARGMYLTDYNRLLMALSYENPMGKKFRSKYLMGGAKEEVERAISGSFSKRDVGYAFTLLSALPHYSYSAEGQQVSVYVFEEQMKSAEKLLVDAGARESGIGNIDVYAAHEGILADSRPLDGGNTVVVSEEQLLMDLYGYQPLLYIGSQLLEQHIQRMRAADAEKKLFAQLRMEAPITGYKRGTKIGNGEAGKMRSKQKPDSG